MKEFRFWTYFYNTFWSFLIFHLLCSAPASFERQFQRELPLLYRYLTEAPSGKVFLQLLCSNVFCLERCYKWFCLFSFFYMCFPFIKEKPLCKIKTNFFPTILFPYRFAGRMWLIGCGLFSQKIGDHGEMTTYIWVHVHLLLVFPIIFLHYV